MQHRTLTMNTRFAWLTPVNGQHNSFGPWLLTENHTKTPSLENTEQSRVSVSSLLQMATSILDIPTRIDSTETRNAWTSQCGAYSITWKKNAGQASRLFVQNADDHFARIEISIHGKLLVAFQEPVWPHLQKMADRSCAERVLIPTACLNAMEFMSAQMSEKTGNAIAQPQQRSRAA